MNVETDHLLHRLWTKAVGTPDYDKEEWKALQRDIEAVVYGAETKVPSVPKSRYTELPPGSTVCVDKARVMVAPGVLVLLNGEPIGVCVFAQAGDPGVLVRILFGQEPRGHAEIVTGPVQLFRQDPEIPAREGEAATLIRKGKSPVHRTTVPYIDLNGKPTLGAT